MMVDSPQTFLLCHRINTRRMTLSDRKFVKSPRVSVEEFVLPRTKPAKLPHSCFEALEERVLLSDWNFATIHSFGGSPDGSNPMGGITIDASGDLFGTTYGGGSGPIATSSGTVFELTKGPSSYSFSTVYSFTQMVNQKNADGARPTGSVASNGQGLVFGATSCGGEQR